MDGDVFPNLWHKEILRNYNGDGEKNKGCGESLIQIQLGVHFLTSVCSHPWLWTEGGWGSGGTLYTGGGEVEADSFQWVASIRNNLTDISAMLSSVQVSQKDSFWKMYF